METVYDKSQELAHVVLGVSGEYFHALFLGDFVDG
jgi:hypothetical protein